MEEMSKREKYKQRRVDLMDEEEIKEADKFLDFFRSSYQDKEDRGLFEKWETIEMYWEGEANPPESDTDPASNTNIVNSSVEGQVAYLVEQNIAIEGKARGPSDLPFRDQAVNLMEWCKERNRMKRKLDVHERRRKKFGVGIFRVLFDPDLIDGLGLPDIQPVNPAYVFPDPAITNVYQVNEGRFMVEITNKPIEYAREKYGDEVADAIEPGYHPMEFEDIFDEFEDGADDIARDNYIHMFVWTRFVDKQTDEETGEETRKRVLRLVEMSGCGVILRDSKKDGTPIVEGSNRYPYFFTPDMLREGTVWAKSSAELLIPTQDLIDDLDDQIRINARLTGNPQREVNVNSGVDPDKLTNEPALVIPTNESGAVNYLKPPDMPGYIIQRRNLALQYERTVVSRWSDQMNGIKQSGVDTATESLGLQQGGTQSISHDKMLLEETLGELFEYCLELMMENYTEEEVFRITEKEDQFMSMRPNDLLNIPVLMKATPSYQQMMQRDFPNAEATPDWMPHPDGLTKKIALDISVTVGSGMPSNKAFIMAQLDKARQTGDITPQEYRKFLKEYMGLPIEEQPPMPPMPQGMPGAPGQMPNPMVGGVTAGGNPALSVVQGGM